MANELLGLAALDCLYLGGGAGLLVAVGWSTLAELRRWIGLAFLAGFAWAGVVGELLLVSGQSFDRTEVVAVTVAPWLLVVAAPRRRSRTKKPGPILTGSQWVAAPALAIAGLTLLRSVAQPLDAWDAWSFWTPKAESIVYFHGLSVAFLHSGIPNANYPPLVPALESAAFRFMGGFDTTPVHVQFALPFVAFIAALAELGRGRCRPHMLGAVLVVIAACPALYLESLSAYADLPLAIFVSLAALFSWQATEETRKAPLALAALFLAAAMATKVEGTVFAAAIAISLVALGGGALRPRVGVLLAFAGAAAVSVVPWRLWLAANAVHGDYGLRAGYLVEHSGRSLRALGALTGNLADPFQWLLLPLVAAVAIVLGLKSRRHEALFTLGTVALSIAALDITYWLSTYPFQWYLNTSASRVVTSPLLVAAVFVPSLTGSTDTARRSSGGTEKTA